MQALCLALYTHYLSRESAQPYEAGILVTPISRKGQPELGDIKPLMEKVTASNSKKNYLLWETFSAK